MYTLPPKSFLKVLYKTAFHLQFPRIRLQLYEKKRTKEMKHTETRIESESKG